jgi:hypothetical protein
MAGPEGERPRVERTAQQSKPTEHHKPHQEGGNGVRGIPPVLQERAKPPPESQERQTGNLDPAVESLMRQYAEAEGEGDPKKAERLYKRYMKNSSLIEFFKDFKLRGARTLTYTGPDFGKLLEKQEEQK